MYNAEAKEATLVISLVPYEYRQKTKKEATHGK